MKKRNINSFVILAVLIVTLGSCSLSKDDTGNEAVTGQAGSLARFSIVNDHLYTVDPAKLHTISILDREHPQKVSAKDLGFYTETIFPYKDVLLLGTDNGMFVFSLSNPAQPTQLSFFQHIRSCDPVVAENDYAYLTLNTANVRCFNGQNQLQIINISNLTSPFLVKTMDLPSPKGLDIKNDTLLVCDNGLKAYNVSDKNSPVLLFHELPANSSDTYNDVIWSNNSILVIGSNGLHQYKLGNNGFQKLSSILVKQ